MAQPPNPKPSVTREQLARHLDLLDQATEEDLDELLTDLLRHTHATMQAQNG